MAIIKTIKVGSTTYDINDSRIADLPLSISQGGTGATTKALAQTALDIDEMLNLGVSASTLISAGTDLDSLTTVGSYYTAGSSATVLNSPAGADAHGYTGGFRLYVMIASSSYLHQIFIPSASNEIWIRRKSNSTTWGAWENINNDTDTKVSQNTLSTDATFPLIVATVSVTGTVGFTTAIYSNPNKSNLTVQGPASSSSAAGAAFRVIPANGNTTVATLMNYEEGTVSSVGTGAVVVGNAVASGNVGNAKGMIILYGENKYSSRITSAAASSSKNQTLPNKEGWIAVGGNGSSSGEGSANTPIYMDTNGELKPVTSIDSSLYDDQYVKQTETDGSNFYPILTTATSIGSASGTLTGSARYNTGVKIAHGKGTVVANGLAGSMAGTNSAGFKVYNTSGANMVAGMWEAVEGTASAVGYGSMCVGNGTASGTAGNAAGRLYVYGTSTGRNMILSDVTNGGSPTNYLPNADGYLAVGDTAGVGSKTVPVYMSSSGVLTAITGSSLFATFTGATGTTGYSITAKVAGQARTVTIPGASDSQAGLVTTGAQTFAGTKTYVTTVYFANGGTYFFSGLGNVTCRTLSVASTATFKDCIIGSYTTAYSTAASVKKAMIISQKPTGAGLTNQIVFALV